MTRKHLKDLANAFKENKPHKLDFDQYGQWCRCVQSIADVCEQHNPRFNRDTFLTACGLITDKAEHKGNFAP